MLGLLGAVVSAGASLIAGNKNRKAAKAANAANRPIQQVKEWEKAGINPIMGITQGQWIPHQGVSMGDAFAAAGGHIARGLELQHQEDLEETELKKENEELRKQLDNVAMRGEPSYMSQYGGLVPLPDPGEQDGKSVQGSDRLLFGNLGPVSASDDRGLFAGVNSEDIVHGTVPYVGAFGEVVPGPNPETQMGVDEVIGWLTMESLSAGSLGLRKAYEWMRTASKADAARVRRFIKEMQADPPASPREKQYREKYPTVWD